MLSFWWNFANGYPGSCCFDVTKCLKVQPENFIKMTFPFPCISMHNTECGVRYQWHSFIATALGLPFFCITALICFLPRFLTISYTISPFFTRMTRCHSKQQTIPYKILQHFKCDIFGLMQKRHDSSVLAMKLHFFCIKPFAIKLQKYGDEMHLPIYGDSISWSGPKGYRLN